MKILESSAIRACGERRVMAEESFDYIVIGSGSAGGVVAARLSEDPSVSVLLLEAGPEDDDDMIHLPVGWAMLLKTKWDWGYRSLPPDDRRRANHRNGVRAGPKPGEQRLVEGLRDTG